LKALQTLNAEEAQVGASFNFGAEFYDGRDYQGHSHLYKESGSVVNLPWSITLGSVKVGHFSKVFAWQTDDQAYEYTSDSSNVRSMNHFKVTPKEVRGVYIRLVDGVNTGTKYCMTPKVYGEGEGADVNSCTDDERYQLLGTLNPTTADEIVTHVPVRNMDHNSPNFGQYIANGSLYFKVDSNGDVSVSHDNREFDNFPENLTIQEVKENTFQITIIKRPSEEPDW